MLYKQLHTTTTHSKQPIRNRYLGHLTGYQGPLFPESVGSCPTTTHSPSTSTKQHRKEVHRKNNPYDIPVPGLINRKSDEKGDILSFSDSMVAKQIL
eukprot:sb/3478965/